MAGEITFAAPVIRAAITSLQNGLPARIAAFNAQAENQVDLVAPAVYHFGGTDTLTAYAFPQVEVAVPSGRTGAWSIGRGQVDHDPVLNVVCWHEVPSGDFATGYELALGMTRCIIETLTRPGAFGADAELGNEGSVFWRTDSIPEDFTDDGREFRRWRVPALIVFRLETVERFG